MVCTINISKILDKVLDIKKRPVKFYFSALGKYKWSLEYKINFNTIKESKNDIINSIKQFKSCKTIESLKIYKKAIQLSNQSNDSKSLYDFY